jgi:F420-0:gamma-glutamyl ligase
MNKDIKQLAAIKKKMKAYRDFYGGDLISLNEIDNATSKKELAGLIEQHRSHMEMMLADAHNHLDHFKNKIGLTYGAI